MIRPAAIGVEAGVFALTRPRSTPSPGSRWRPLLALAAAAALAFSNGRHTVPLLAWIGPLLLLHWLRAAPSGRSGRWVGPAAYALFLSAWIVQWWGIVRSPPFEFAITAVAIAAMGFSPYLLDRWVARRLPAAASSWIGTLVFPSALVAMETLWSHFGPNGSFGAIGYTQANDTPLLQVAALAGVAGLSFLVGWVASAGSLLWRRLEDGARGPALLIGVAIALVLVASHAGGALRLRLADAVGTPASRSRALRAVAVSPQLDDNVNYDLAVSGEIQDFLFARSEAEIRDGARLVVWPEDSFAVTEEDQPDFRRRAARFAAQHAIYLAVGYGVRPDPASRRFANQLALWGPDGRQLWEYRKVHPVPGFEQRYMERGLEPMPERGHLLRRRLSPLHRPGGPCRSRPPVVAGGRLARDRAAPRQDVGLPRRRTGSGAATADDEWPLPCHRRLRPSAGAVGPFRHR